MAGTTRSRSIQTKRERRSRRAPRPHRAACRGRTASTSRSAPKRRVSVFSLAMPRRRRRNATRCGRWISTRPPAT
eukprot:4815481-Prymnesium_polylepis.1